MSVNLGTHMLEASTQRNQNEAVIVEGVITPKPLAVGRGCLDVSTMSDPAGLIEECQKVKPGDEHGVR